MSVVQNQLLLARWFEHDAVSAMWDALDLLRRRSTDLDVSRMSKGFHTAGRMRRALSLFCKSNWVSLDIALSSRRLMRTSFWQSTNAGQKRITKARAFVPPKRRRPSEIWSLQNKTLDPPSWIIARVSLSLLWGCTFAASRRARQIAQRSAQTHDLQTPPIQQKEGSLWSTFFWQKIGRS